MMIGRARLANYKNTSRSKQLINTQHTLYSLSPVACPAKFRSSHRHWHRPSPAVAMQLVDTGSAATAACRVISNQNSHQPSQQNHHSNFDFKN
jgi:hypothetical protein